MGKEKKEKTLGLLFYVTIVLCVFLLAVAEGLESRVDVSFNPINGDFQHYNMFRRLLDGQVPFRDFFVMLGLGVMYTNSLVLLVIGNTFANGVFSTHFLLVLSGFFVVFVLCRLFLQNSKASALISLIFTIYTICFDTIRSVVVNIFPWMDILFSRVSTITSGVTPLFVPDNASRPLRQMILYFAALIVMYYLSRERKGDDHLSRETLYIGLYGAFAGGCFLWANDYGPATYVGLAFVLFLWYSRKWTRKQLGFLRLVSYCVLYVASSFASLFILVTILTHGNFMMWFRSSFSTAGEVFWYNGIVLDGAKLLHLTEMPPLDGKGVYSIIFTVVSFVAYIAAWYFSKEEKRQYLPHILITTALIFVFYFLIIKRGYEIEYLNAFHQYAFFGTLGYGWNLISKPLKKKEKCGTGRIVPAVILLVLTVVSVGYSLNVYFWYPGAKEELSFAYVDGLGGNVVSFHEDITSAAEKLKGKTLFSTYSTAVETVNDVYQPSRYDYITFTFGDRARQEYVEAFEQSDPDYVSIINRDYTRWEGPISGVKWFFYRHLLDEYSYDFSNTYARYLKKTGVSSNVNTEHSIEIVSDGAGGCDIYVYADEKTIDLVADVKLTYESNYLNNRFSTLTVNKMVTVTGDSHYFFPTEFFQCWFIPEKSQEWYLPIMIEAGVGHVHLQTYPVECTSLNLQQVEVMGVYDFSKVFGSNFS